MITLKLVAYNQSELQLLHTLIRQDIQFCLHKCDPSKCTCKTCEYRHLCSDLSRAEHFVYNQINKG